MPVSLLKSRVSGFFEKILFFCCFGIAIIVDDNYNLIIRNTNNGNQNKTKGKTMFDQKTIVTQKQVNKAIDHLILEAAKFEFARDQAEFESKEYWENHDYAMNLILAAEQLMPQEKKNPFTD